MKDNQRRAMFARLKAQGFSPRLQTAIVKNPKLQDMNFKQIGKKGVFLRFQADSDKDGVVNIKDCKPLDKKRQGIIHDLIKANEKRVKQKSKEAEREQDKLLNKIDKESTTLNKQLKLQKKLKENKDLKQELSVLKRTNFLLTPAGKVVAVTGKGLRTIGRGFKKTITSKEAKRLVKKLTR